MDMYWIVVLASSIWVLVDAKTIGVRKGQIQGLGNLGPWGWFFACLLLWIISFPFYLAKRPEFKHIQNGPSENKPTIAVAVLSASSTNPGTKTTFGTILKAIGLVFVGFIVLSCVIGYQSLRNFNGAPPEGKQKQNEQIAAVTAQPVKSIASKSEPHDMLAKDSVELIQIEQRLRENEKKLKKFYGTEDQLAQASKDGLHLVMMKVNHLDNGKSKVENTFGQSAAKLLSQVAAQRREIYASTLEETFVKNGMDIKVTATGMEKKLLRIVYALMSQPMVYKFQNEAKLKEQAATLGFSKLIYTNGFESGLGETWAVAIKE